MKKTLDYQGYLIKSLENKEEAQAYLNAALENGNIESFLLALRNVIAAQGGMSALAEKVHKSRSSLYRTLSDRGNPELKGMYVILRALNMKLIISPS